MDDSRLSADGHLLKTMGRLGDLRGKKVIFLSRQVIFALDSLL